TRQLLPCIGQPTDQRYCEAGPSAVAANRDVRSRNILIPQKTPCGQRIVIRSWKRMLGRESIGNSQGARSSGATHLSHQATMTDNRTGAIATPVKKHENAGGIAAWNDGPFAR